MSAYGDGILTGVEAPAVLPAGGNNEPLPLARLIRLAAGERPRVVREGIDALRRANLPIYNRGGQLVRLVRLDAAVSADGIRRPLGATILIPVRAPWLRLRLGEAAGWERFVRREKEWIPADPPTDVAETIATTPDEGDWPVLRAIVKTPVVWPDGTWSATPGYQRGLYLDIEGPWPEPGTTRDAAENALEALRHHYRHMAWASEQDAAAGLSLAITAVHRQMLDIAPMHAIDAPTAGTGKSLLNDSAAILATGARAAVMDYGRDPVEATKRLDSMLLAGDTMIAIDNVEAPLEGSTLCQTLTQPERKIRPLGTHNSYAVPCTVLITATGNNLAICGDLVRRSIVCRLDARTERPDTREIDQDLLAETFERRAELVAACQTIIRAYILAGRPKVGIRPLGLFKEWADVQSALVWLGMPDPAGSVDRAMADDPSRQELHAVFTAWHAAFSDEPATSADAIQRAEHDSDLREALAAVCTRKGGMDGRALGYWLRHNRDARSGGLVLTRHSTRGGSYRWAVRLEGRGHGGHRGHVSLLHARDGKPDEVIGAETSPQSPLSHLSPTADCPKCLGEGDPDCYCGGTGRLPSRVVP